MNAFGNLERCLLEIPDGTLPGLSPLKRFLTQAVGNEDGEFEVPVWELSGVIGCIDDWFAEPFGVDQRTAILAPRA